MQHASLRLKLILAVIIVFVISMSVLIWFSSHSLVNTQDFAERSMQTTLKKQAEKTLNSISDLTQQQINAFLNKAISSTLVLQSQLEQTALARQGQPLSREQVKSLTLHALESNPVISAMYAQFEQNGYDNQDAAFIDNLALGSNTGTLDIYWVRENGDFTFYPTEDVNEKYLATKNEHGIREAEWYLCSYDSLKPCLLDPYLYEVSAGNKILMTTFTKPIISNNRFLGLVGIDINLPVIQQKVEQMQHQVYEGAGNITVVSQKNLIVASSQYPKAVSKPLKQTSSLLAEISTQNGLIKREANWYVVSSIEIDEVGNIWKVMVSIDEQTILAPALKLTNKLQEEVTRSELSLLMIGVIAIGITAIFIGFLIKSITQPIEQVAQRMNELSSNEGDLSQTLPAQNHAELIALADGFNLFASKLREMIIAMKHQKDNLLNTAIDMANNASAVEGQSQLQQNKLDSVVTAITEMAASATEVAQLAQNTADLSQQASVSIESSQAMLEKNTQSIHQLDNELTSATQQVGLVSDRTQDIYGILTTIRGIAEQTNLLALNAAIEAARAGEMGRGFAVVADEVRTLAARTQESTEEVDALIKNLQKEVEMAVSQLTQSRTQMKETVVDTQAAFDSLVQAVTQVQQIDENTTQVATAAEEQSMVSEDISRSITEVGDAANELAQLAKVSAQLTKDSNDAVQQLDNQLDRLKV